MTILVTGAAGYIGSHTMVALLEAGHQPIAVDNYCNSNPESLKRVTQITGKTFPVYEMDVRNEGGSSVETLLQRTLLGINHHRSRP